MRKQVLSLVLACALCAPLAACETPAPGPRIAVVDVQKVLASGPHAAQAKEQTQKAQATYQGNVDSIKAKLGSYTNRAQADAIYREAGRQLQNQYNTYCALTNRAMADVLMPLIAAKSAAYDLILPKSATLASKAALDITAEVQKDYDAVSIKWPDQPHRIEDPALPADRPDDMTPPPPPPAPEAKPADKKPG